MVIKLKIKARDSNQGTSTEIKSGFKSTLSLLKKSEIMTTFKVKLQLESSMLQWIGKSWSNGMFLSRNPEQYWAGVVHMMSIIYSSYSATGSQISLKNIYRFSNQGLSEF